MATLTTEMIDQESTYLTTQAREISIATAEDYQRAGTLVKELALTGKQIDQAFDPIIESAHLNYKKALEQKRQYSQPVEDAGKLLRRKMADYDEKEHQRAAEEQRKIAEQLRKEEEDRRLAEAVNLEKAGDHQTAELLIEMPVVIAPVTVPAAPKIDGISYVERWTFEITDPKLVPLEYKIPDEKKLGAVVQAMKAQTNIPGIRAYPVKSTRVKV